MIWEVFQLTLAAEIWNATCSGNISFYFQNGIKTILLFFFIFLRTLWLKPAKKEEETKIKLRLECLKTKKMKPRLFIKVKEFVDHQSHLSIFPQKSDLRLRLNSLKVVFYFSWMKLTFTILCVSQGTSSTRDEKNIGVAIIPVIWKMVQKINRKKDKVRTF